MIGGRGSKTGTPVTDRERQQRKEAAESRWQGHSAKPASNQIDPANVVKPQDVPARFIPSGGRPAGEGIDVNVPYGTNYDDAIANRDARALVKAQRQRVLDIIRKKQYALRHWYPQGQLRERYGVPENPWLRNKSAIERTVVAMSKTGKRGAPYGNQNARKNKLPEEINHTLFILPVGVGQTWWRAKHIIEQARELAPASIKYGVLTRMLGIDRSKTFDIDKFISRVEAAGLTVINKPKPTKKLKVSRE